jgi:hypothetical protein
LGSVTAYVWGSQPGGTGTGGGSPHSGPVATYIWKNPNDTGSGIPRTITDPVPDASPTNNSWVFDSTPENGTVPVNWNLLNSDGTIESTIPLFDPQLESEGYEDFNCCIVGNLFVPAAGTYAFSLQYKDQVMMGMSEGATLISTSGYAPLSSSPVGTFGQTISVINSLPLLFVSNIDGGGGNHTTTLNIHFSQSGVYQLELDWDYWSHTGRSLILTCVQSSFAQSPTIPPLPQGVRTGVLYRYTYRSSATGAVSNPSPESSLQVTPVLANSMYSVYSSDPQVDKVDYYRVDDAITNFTYVLTGPNDGLGGTINGVLYNTPVTDELSDTAIISNPLLQFDNFEPFPVTDLPRSGVANSSNGIITWVSGDLFNIRWLPGTLISGGYPTQIAYSLISRPYPADFEISTVYALNQIILDPASHYQQVTIPGTSGASVPTFNDSGGTTVSGGVTFKDMGLVAPSGYVTKIMIPDIPDGTNISYSIPAPELAAQPLPYLWGPTDNTAYMFGVGDPDNPGTLYFTKGNNPDSAPDTNSIVVTSPAEPLMNGCITAGLGMVFSTERRWLIYPTFITATATVSGISGSQFNLVLAQSDRGLYIATCLCTDGGSLAFYRAKDGIYSCTFGGGDQFLCADIYNLFPREGVIPSPITIAGYTIYPPDDTKPSAQKLSYANGYLYYDYEDTTSTPRTLVFDQIAGGWSVDVGQYPFTVHALEEGPDTNTTMVGCTDGSVRVLGSGNSETATSVVVTGANNAGDARAFKRVGDVFIKALVAASNPITVALYANQYAQALSDFSPASLVGTGSLQPYIVDFTAGYGNDLIDLGLVLSWSTQSGNVLDLWQPDFIALPETTQDRPTDWDDGGFGGLKFVQGMILEANSFNVSKQVTVQISDDLSIKTPNESPIIFNGQSIKPLTFTPPFLAHSMRIVSTDGVPWNKWGVKWVYEPFPESTVEWQTEFTSHGLPGWQHIREVNIAYSSNAPLTLTFTFGPEANHAPILLTIPSSSGLQTKYKTPVPANKYKVVSYGITSTQPFYLFKNQCETKLRAWGSSGSYMIVQPFGGPNNLGAEV